jgi:hypothetical protein
MIKKSGSGEGIGCFVLIIVVAINLTIGAWSVNQILSWFGKDIPIIADIIIGLFVGEVSIPVAIIGWILKICGVF